MIDDIRAREPDAVFRSSFIVGFPGETEASHDTQLEFLEAAALDWAGFFTFSPEDGTPASSLPGAVDDELMGEWLRECQAVQDPITRASRDALVGSTIEVLVDGRDDGPANEGDGDGVLVGRTYREAPEIDGVVRLDAAWARPGALVRAHVTEAVGPDLLAKGDKP
jgi:ribosomal protein S12 methylthiotransferase